MTGATGLDEAGFALGLVETARQIASRRLSPVKRIADGIGRARAVEDRIHAFAHFAARPTSAPGGPLRGVPVAVKDLIDTADMPTECGSRAYGGRRPKADAVIVSRLRDAGATIIGKSVTTEFAWRSPGPTRNPWSLGRTPGGSSSGSAAAVAAGVVPLAFGSQTFGSVIRPAAFCGVVGFKPSFDALPLAGVQALSPSLDHLGLLTRSACDAAFAFAILREATTERMNEAAAHFLSGRESPRPPARIALARTPFWSRAEPAQRNAIDEAAERLRAGGCVVEEIEIGGYEEAGDAARIILACEAAAVFDGLIESHADLIGEPLRDLVREGRSHDARALAAARDTRERLHAAWRGALTGFDAALTPPALGEAPDGLDNTGDPLFCTPWTLVGFPAITLPRGFGLNGMPLGVQLVAPFGADDRLLGVAMWFEDRFGAPIGIAPC